MNADNAHDRFTTLAREWRVGIDHSFETSNSLMGFGLREGTHVVLKVIKQVGDEWWSGGALNAFGARACVRVLEHMGGAMLMERLTPGNSLTEIVRQGDDDAVRETNTGGRCVDDPQIRR